MKNHTTPGDRYAVNSLLTSLLSIPNTLAPIPAGYCADKYGRKTTIVVLFITFVVSLTITAFCPVNLYVYEATRMIQAACMTGAFSPFVTINRFAIGNRYGDIFYCVFAALGFG